MPDSSGVRLPEIFDDLDIGINLHDPDDEQILDANDRLTELYGYSVAELRTMKVGDYTAPSTRFHRQKRLAGSDSLRTATRNRSSGR